MPTKASNEHGKIPFYISHLQVYWNETSGQQSTRPEDERDCAIYVVLSTYLSSMSKNILQTCRRISQRQPIADLHLERIKCEGDSENSDVFRLSQGASSLNLRDCTLPVHVLTHLLDQLPKCTSLGKYS